ncbi:hypothetical protein [uncultured Shewanella sp.]|uniref:hypothetical protein n=1 Tax=uncultured Shewanella sp. TaxID=173975 RepID=UPI0026291183|nr:hypothetical protein [uncultured Shewanella sp.]
MNFFTTLFSKLKGNNVAVLNDQPNDSKSRGIKDSSGLVSTMPESDATSSAATIPQIAQSQVMACQQAEPIEPVGYKDGVRYMGEQAAVAQPSLLDGLGLQQQFTEQDIIKLNADLLNVTQHWFEQMVYQAFSAKGLNLWFDTNGRAFWCNGGEKVALILDHNPESLYSCFVEPFGVKALLNELKGIANPCNRFLVISSGKINQPANRFIRQFGGSYLDGKNIALLLRWNNILR